MIEAISIPNNLSTYKIDFPRAPGVNRPCKNTGSAISEHLSNSSPTPLEYRPYLCLDLSRKSGIPSIIEHQKVIDAWKSAVKNSPNPQPSSIHQYLLYPVIFVFSDDISHFPDAFGGYVAKFNNIGPMRRNAVIESPAYAISCDQYLHTKLPSIDRERTPSVDYCQLLSEELFEIERYATGSLQQTKAISGKVRKGRRRTRISRRGKEGGGDISEIPTDTYSRAASASETPVPDAPKWGNRFCKTSRLRRPCKHIDSVFNYVGHSIDQVGCDRC